jgi:hypothetical protein
MSAFDELAEFARDEAYAVMGDAAEYLPPNGGDRVTCTIMLDVRDNDAKPEDGRPPVGQVTIMVRSSEIPHPEAGGTFTLSESGKTYDIVSRPLPVDAAGQEWSMWAEPV